MWIYTKSACKDSYTLICHAGACIWEFISFFVLNDFVVHLPRTVDSQRHSTRPLTIIAATNALIPRSPPFYSRHEHVKSLLILVPAIRIRWHWRIIILFPTAIVLLIKLSDLHRRITLVPMALRLNPRRRPSPPAENDITPSLELCRQRSRSFESLRQIVFIVAVVPRPMAHAEVL